jgi:hypothetical protein
MMCRLALAGGAILLALTGCSGGSKANNAASTSSAAATSASSAAATTSSSSAPAPAGDAAFCGQAQSFVDQVQAAVQSQPQQQTDFGQKLPALVGELQSITPPPAIAADWQTALSALQQMAAAFQGVNLSDPQQIQQLEQKVAPIETQLGAAGQHIEDYLKTQCGITAGSTG